MQMKITKFALPLALSALATPAPAEVRAFPSTFHVQEIPTDGALIHVRVGGKGPAVVMLHGFGDTGDMWAPVAAMLVQDHTIVVPDLRGMGLSMGHSRPALGQHCGGSSGFGVVYAGKMIKAS